MSRKIFITESQCDALKQMITEGWLSNSVLSNTFTNTEKKYNSKREAQVENVVKTILGDNFTTNVNELKTLLSTKLNECKVIEKGNEEYLEKLCADGICEFLGDFQNEVTLTCELTNEITDKNIIVHTAPKENDITFDDSEEIKDIDNFIEKRRILLYIIIGASIMFTKFLLKKKKNEINKLDNNLYNKYREILWVSEYLLFKETLNITDKEPNQGGGVIVTLGNDEIKTEIKSVALLFPLLLFETFKGFFELFISHGLPDKKEYASYVMDNADILDDEQEGMKVGPILWNKIISITDNFESTTIPYFISELSKCDKDSLLEVCLGTKKGKDLLINALNEIKYNIDYSDFEDRLYKKRSEKTLVTDDEFMSPDELIDEEYLTIE